MNDIYKSIICFLCLVGAAAIAFVGYSIISVLIMMAADHIKKLRRKRQIKKRFNKPLTAKCYSIDYMRHKTNNGTCYLLSAEHDYYTGDISSCFQAEPREEEL